MKFISSTKAMFLILSILPCSSQATGAITNKLLLNKLYKISQPPRQISTIIDRENDKVYVKQYYDEESLPKTNIAKKSFSSEALQKLYRSSQPPLKRTIENLDFDNDIITYKK